MNEEVCNTKTRSTFCGSQYNNLETNNFNKSTSKKIKTCSKTKWLWREWNEGYHVLMIIKLLKEVIDKFFFVILLVS